MALENARRKARAVVERVRGAPVVGVDTVVALDSRIYGKPADPRAARATLRALSGRAHEVIGGVWLIGSDGAERGASATTRVEFRELDRQTVEWYVRGGEWRERAGGYAIQGMGAALVRRIEGDYLNVVGLPAATLIDLDPDLLHR